MDRLTRVSLPRAPLFPPNSHDPVEKSNERVCVMGVFSQLVRSDESKNTRKIAVRWNANT